MGQSLREAPAGARGLAVEAACLATHVALYPAAALSRRRREARPDHHRLADLPPLRRGLIIGDLAAAETPILLVHGLVDNRSVFTRLERALRRRGFTAVSSVDIPLFATNVPAAAAQLAAAVEQAVDRHGYPRVHIVAHSLGGLVARYYVQRLDGDERVRTLVTLATPHSGTRLADLLPRAVPYPLIDQLRPGSSLLRELAEPAPDCRTRFLAFAGSLDTVVRPAEAALTHPDLVAENLVVDGVGHHALPFSNAVAHLIACRLAPADPPESQPRPVPPSGTRAAPARPDQAPRRSVPAPRADAITQSLENSG